MPFFQTTVINYSLILLRGLTTPNALLKGALIRTKSVEGANCLEVRIKGPKHSQTHLSISQSIYQWLPRL